MILSDKALELFASWLSHHELHWYFEDLPDFVQLAYYVKWLDEMNVYALAEYSFKLDMFYGSVCVLHDEKLVASDWMESRESALTAAVIKAGEIINERLLTK